MYIKYYFLNVGTEKERKEVHALEGESVRIAKFYDWFVHCIKSFPLHGLKMKGDK